MAEVLEAIAVGEHGFERKVAIKRMLATTGEEAAMYQRMFLDEARISSQLHHANIVAVVDYGIADGLPFQVLEYVDGVDVRALVGIPDRPLPVELALYICSSVGHALEYAHGVADARGQPLGIVHRDVTPGNILVAWSGDVKLTDFGIAFAHERSEKTLDGTTKGTPVYMSPEQMLGDTIDLRTDLFTLGCVLHTMVAGWSPLSKDEQRFHVIAGGELTLADDLPDDVRAIVARATRHAPRDRYASASELVAALAVAIAKRGIVDPRSSLRTWMHGLRAHQSGVSPAPANPPARGRLDALLDVAFVLDGAEDSVRQFHSVAGATLPARPGGALAHDPPTHRLPPPVEPPPAPVTEVGGPVPGRISPWWWLALAVGACAVTLTVVLVLRKLDALEPARIAEATPDAVTVAVPPAPPDAAAPPDASASDAAAPPDAAPPADAAPSPRTVVTVADRPPVRTTPSTRDDRVVREWGAHRRRRMLGELDAWIDAHRSAAIALKSWDTKYENGTGELVAWVAANPSGSFDDYVAANPKSSFAALFKRHGNDLETLLPWLRDSLRPMQNLVRRGQGFPWALTSLGAHPPLR